MNVRNVMELLVLGAIWGASFLFIKVAVPEFGAVALMAVRVALAAMVLAPLIMARGRVGETIRHWRPIALVGLLHYALPFSLFAWAMMTLSAGYTSVINASAPLFAGLVARAWLGERLEAGRAAGLVIGLFGVVMLVWNKLAVGTGSVATATGAAVLASFCYGFSAVLARKKLAGVNAVAVAGGSMAAASAILLPLSFWLWPAALPSAGAWGMAAVLGVLCTAVAFVLYFRLIAAIGPANAITVTFLIPVFAVIFAALLLGEQVTLPMSAGGLLIFLGTALSTGLLRIGSLAGRSRALLARGLVIVLIPGTAVFHSSPAHASDWQFATPVYVAANTFSSRNGEGWDTFSTLAASAELEWSSLDGPWLGSLFAEYHASPDRRVDGTVFAGLLAGYYHGSLDVTAWWFTSRYPGQPGRATSQTRIRHRLANGHKLGVEYIACMDDWRRGELKLGYYASLNRSLSLKVLAGARVGNAHQPVARVELSWRMH